VEAGHLDEGEHQMLVGLLQRLQLPTWHALLRDPALFEGIGEFREHLGGELCITLLQGVGRPIEINEVREDVLLLRGRSSRCRPHDAARCVNTD
jgi:3-dehydroquinate synthase